MPSPLGDAVGERLELREYYADFRQNFSRTREFWMLESGQDFAEPGNASWEAFNRGEWAASLRLVEDLRTDLKEYFRELQAAGTSTYRIRIVSLPLTPYLQWEFHVLRLRDEAGEPMRILLDSDVAAAEDQGRCPTFTRWTATSCTRPSMTGSASWSTPCATPTGRWWSDAVTSSLPCTLAASRSAISSRGRSPPCRRRVPSRLRSPMPTWKAQAAPTRSVRRGTLLSDAERPAAGAGEVRSEIERASVTGDVVQARDVSGGVHFHTPQPGSRDPRLVPRQLPAAVSAFVNRKPEIRALTRLVTPRGARLR